MLTQIKRIIIAFIIWVAINYFLFWTGFFVFEEQEHVPSWLTISIFVALGIMWGTGTCYAVLIGSNVVNLPGGKEPT